MRGLKLRKTDLAALIRDSLEALSPPDTVRVVFLPEITDGDVWFDHERMVTALVDLEQNALEAMPRGGILTVSAEDSRDRVVIAVSDTGTGMTRDALDNLFTPFFTTKPVGEGTGLGLPSVYSVVKAHGGDLTVESNDRPEQGPTGTTVRITLPRRLIHPESRHRVIIHDNE